MKNLTLLVALLLVNSAIIAQSPRNYFSIPNGWTDLNLNGKIKGKFSWQLENQHRRQDMQGEYNEMTATHNPFHNLNQHVFRPYIHYQLNPNIKFSLMPLGWIGSNRFKNGQAYAFFSELRVSPQIIVSHNIGRVRFDNRFRYEFRWLGKDRIAPYKDFLYQGDFSTTTFKRRFRYQIKLTAPLNKPKMEDKTLYAQAYDEFFINMGEKVGNLNIFDQNRVLIGLGYRFNKFFSAEAGYMQQAIFKFNNATQNNVDLNNIIQLNFVVNNIESLFKKEPIARKP